MIKVLLILENSPSLIGGIERHCYNIINLFRGDKEIVIDVLSKKNVKHFYLKTGRKIVFSQKDLCEKIEMFLPDIVHIHGFASFAVVQAINCSVRLKKKVIYTAHFHPFYTLDNPFLGKLFFYFFLFPALKKINAMITINKEDSSFFRKYVKYITMVPHWIDNTIYISNVVKNNKLVLFIGRAEPNKGLEHLYMLSKIKYEIHCVSNGEFERTDFILHKNILDDELYQLYSQASVVVIPSRYEAFSYVALESLLMGTPIVISNRVRIADYLNDFVGQGIEIFPFGDFRAFNIAVEKAIKQKVDVNSISNIFDKEQIKNKLFAIYRQQYIFL
jgi:glycosyltransferase involved in cell wall biosynthesis